MSTLGKPSGNFILHESDCHVGSFFSTKDLYEILRIDLIPYEDFVTILRKLNLIRKNGMVDESKLYKHYKDIVRLYSSNQIKGQISFDEYVLRKLIELALPDAQITPQAIIPDLGARTKIDFLIEHKSRKLYLEFDGPHHFRGTRGCPPKDSRERQESISDKTGIECVIWPYWIQRCELNVKALFDNTIIGYGALWSTNILFGDFTITTPSLLIKEETLRFNAMRPEGIGYFYGCDDDEKREIPRHRIIEQIIKGESSIERIIPPDVKTDKEFWLPKCLWDYI